MAKPTLFDLIEDEDPKKLQAEIDALEKELAALKAEKAVVFHGVKPYESPKPLSVAERKALIVEQIARDTYTLTLPDDLIHPSREFYHDRIAAFVEYAKTFHVEQNATFENP